MTPSPAAAPAADNLKSKRILVVDDEPNIVNAVRRELSKPPFVRYRYVIEGFTDPGTALARAAEQPFDAVISDYRMPDMNGVEFLNALAKLQPECARLVLSGHTDMDGLIRMINETHVYRFIPKPWHDYYLRGSLAQALDYSTTINEHQRLAGIVRQHNIPIPPLEPQTQDVLLIVDDDPGVLASLTRIFSQRSQLDELFLAIRSEVAQQQAPILEENKLKVQTATSARQALHFAEAQTCACIIADLRPSDMDGIELLQRFADLQPDCARILISDQSGLDDLVNAIDLAQVFAYIEKPWSDYEIKACVALAVAQRKLHRENRLLAEIVRKSTRINA